MNLGVFLVLTGLAIFSGCTALFGSEEEFPLLDGRIVGGNPVSINDYPYQVSLQLFLFVTQIHLCGGSIISDKWIITSAHCIISNNPKLYKIRAGSTNRNSGGTVFAVAQIIVHSQWKPPSLDYDYAVVQIKKTFPIGTTGFDAVVLTDTAPTTGTSATVSGWGILSLTSLSLPKDLHAVDVLIVDHGTCVSDYSLITTVTNNMICAADTGKDACLGDSGGPLIDSTTKKLLGIVSFGFGCAKPSYPGVYASIASVRAWITTQTGV